eukprot:COSAG05_NODE_2912_length_2514_cov_1.633540_3_plen_113_part_01
MCPASPRPLQVCFEGLTDVSRLDLTAAELVWDGKPGRCTGVELYPCSRDAHPDSSFSGGDTPRSRAKPPVGTGLNKPATVTLCFRKGFGRDAIRADIDSQGGMRFVDYSPVTG